jgi:hypothetical protein
MVARASAGLGALIAGALVLAACHRQFTCDDDTQCGNGGDAGTCEPNGSCSFPAGDCESGRRYGEHAAKDLVDRCVAPTNDTLAGTGASTGATSSEGGSSTAGAESTTSMSDGDPCTGLDASAPVVATANDQIIEGLHIVAADGPGIAVEGVSGVTIRNCEIHHSDGPGIRFNAADDITIENVIVVHDGAPAQGSHDGSFQANIEGRFSEGVTIANVRLRDGASGIDLEGTPGAALSFVESFDVRGPDAAACVSIVESDLVVLSDFYCANDLVVSRPFNVVEIEHSSDVTVQRGLLDGHNAEFGYGVHFTQISGQHIGGLVEDVDAIRMTNGAFSCFDFGENLTFSRTRVRENICEIVSIPIEGCATKGPNGGCVPGSNGVTWTASLGSSGIVLLDSVYQELCAEPVWPVDTWTIAEGDLVEEPFELRARPEISFCWE